MAAAALPPMAYYWPPPDACLASGDQAQLLVPQGIVRLGERPSKLWLSRLVKRVSFNSRLGSQVGEEQHGIIGDRVVLSSMQHLQLEILVSKCSIVGTVASPTSARVLLRKLHHDSCAWCGIPGVGGGAQCPF